MTATTSQADHRIVARVAWVMHAAAVASGLDVDILDFFPGLDSRDRNGFITVEQQRVFTRFIFGQPDESIGLRFGSNVLFQGLGMVGFLFRASPTFGDYLERADRYHRVYARDAEFRIERRENGMAMVFPEPDATIGPREQVVMARMSKWISWGRQLCGPGLAPYEARFRWAGPANRETVTDYFNCAVRYGQDEDCLLFDAATFATPLHDYTPEMSQELEQYAAALVAKLSGGDTFLSRVRIAIEDSIAGGANSEVEVARRLAMTPRTLHRHLRQEQTSFRDLRDLILQQHARALLRRPDVPVGEVAYQLGYSDPSTFSRAFKRWTGTAPHEWRQQSR